MSRRFDIFWDFLSRAGERHRDLYRGFARAGQRIQTRVQCDVCREVSRGVPSSSLDANLIRTRRALASLVRSHWSRLS